MTVRIGIDTGGTFTDFVLLDEETGAVRTAKVPSTPSRPSEAIGAGIGELPGVSEISGVIVGTTVATNAIIERRGSTVVFVTNEGFEDVPFIGRLDKERLYDLHWAKPKPLVLRRHAIGVAGRVSHTGEVLDEIDSDALAGLVRRLEEIDAESPAVAICLLFSYLRSEHELAVAGAVRQALPDADVSLSSEISPVWREYERASTTIADAYVKPIITGYVRAVGSVLESELGIDRWNLLTSSGGYLRADQAGRRPAQLLLSGLAGGVIGARFFAEAAGYPSVFSLDMGGTSCDIGLVLDGHQQHSVDFEVAWGVPVSIPCVAVRTIGAGGGSIAWIDKGGLLHVGPRSAGAEPGPVAYGRGGVESTVTDANLTLGRLNANFFLGGAVALDDEAARKALEDLGAQLEVSAEAAALAVVRTADENMANAVRLIAVERGLDPREFALISFGGAGPLHARAVAERLDMSTVLVPPHPGLCSAFGATIAEARVDRVRTFYARSDSVDTATLAAVERALCDEAVDQLRRSIEVDEPALARAADMRYAGQSYEVEVPLPEGELDDKGWAGLLARFEEEHDRKYGFRLAGETVELINLRVSASRAEARPILAVAGEGTAEPHELRPVWLDPEGPVECPIYRRGDLPAGSELEGPAIVEEPDSTTLVFAGDTLRVDASGVLILTLGEGS